MGWGKPDSKSSDGNEGNNLCLAGVSLDQRCWLSPTLGREKGGDKQKPKTWKMGSFCILNSELHWKASLFYLNYCKFLHPH